MTRQQKINRIKHLIDGYNNIKDYVLTNKFFYTDGNNFYTDRTHKNKIDKEFIAYLIEKIPIDVRNVSVIKFCK